jgi:hypothetical protein
VTPCEVRFTPAGTQLLVTAKGAISAMDVFTVEPDGSHLPAGDRAAVAVAFADFAKALHSVPVPQGVPAAATAQLARNLQRLQAGEEIGERPFGYPGDVAALIAQRARRGPAAASGWLPPQLPGGDPAAETPRSEALLPHRRARASARNAEGRKVALACGNKSAGLERQMTNRRARTLL